MTLIIAILLGLINRWRGLDTPDGWISNRITASVIAGLLLTKALQANDAMLWDYPLTIILLSLTWFLWAWKGWLPNVNWSASKPIRNFTGWYYETVVRQLHSIPFFIVACFAGFGFKAYIASIVLVFGWGLWQYMLGPNGINLSFVWPKKPLYYTTNEKGEKVPQYLFDGPNSLQEFVIWFCVGLTLVWGL